MFSLVAVLCEWMKTSTTVLPFSSSLSSLVNSNRANSFDEDKTWPESTVERQGALGADRMIQSTTCLYAWIFVGRCEDTCVLGWIGLGNDRQAVKRNNSPKTSVLGKFTINPGRRLC